MPLQKTTKPFQQVNKNSTPISNKFGTTAVKSKDQKDQKDQDHIELSDSSFQRNKTDNFEYLE